MHISFFCIGHFPPNPTTHSNLESVVRYYYNVVGDICSLVLWSMPGSMAHRGHIWEHQYKKQVTSPKGKWHGDKPMIYLVTLDSIIMMFIWCVWVKSYEIRILQTYICLKNHSCIIWCIMANSPKSTNLMSHKSIKCYWKTLNLIKAFAI